MVHPHLLIDDKAALDGILREVQIAGRLARFCTAQVITTGEEHGRPYVVSEYVPGPTLILGPDGPVVIDFGIARALDSAVHTTRTGQLLGTPSYVAPE